MSQTLRRIPPGGIVLLTLKDSFLHFLAQCTFTLKFWGSYYSEVEQNLLPRRKKGEVSNKVKFRLVEFLLTFDS